MNITSLLIFLITFFMASPCFAHQQNDQSARYRFHFSDIPKHAVGDIKSTFWKWNGLALLVGSGASLAFLPVDDDVKNHFSGDPLFSKDFDRNFGHVISPYTLGGASLIAFIVGTQIDNPRFSLAAESAVESWIMTMTLTTGLKFAIQRTRPNGGNYSMPSGHTASAFSLATVLTEFYGLKAAIPAYALAGTVAFCRIDGNYHHLSDVLMGAVLGTVIGIGTSEFHKKENPTFFVLPEITTHGTTLTFHKSF